MFDWFKRLAALSALALVAACGGGDDDPHPGNIVQIAQASSRLFRGSDEGEDVPDRLPARMVNEFVFCPRFFHLSWVDGRDADKRPHRAGEYVADCGRGDQRREARRGGD